ncbi:ABC transporter substrate-binding protein [Nannocystaceae bacterium ST9]
MSSSPRFTALPGLTGSPLRLAALAFAGLAAGLTGACSLTLSFDECQVDADCIDAGYTCDNGKCVGGDDEVGTDSGTGSETATDSGSETATDSGTDTIGDECTSHLECVAAHSETWVCGSAGTCMNAITPECQIFAWPNGTPSDDVVIVGSIMAVSPPFDTLVLPLQNAVDMAVEEFNDEAELPDGQKLAWIACDSKGSTDLAKAAAEHLVATGAPAIVGPIFSEEVLAVAQDVTIPAGVFLITPTGSNKNITSLADDDLVWRTISSDTYQANAIADRLLAVPDDKLGTLPLGPLDFDNMVIVHKNDAYGTDLATDIVGALDPSLGNVTDVYGYDVPLDTDDLQTEIGNLLAPIAGGANPPEIVVIAGTSEAQAIILIYLSLANTLNPAPPFPYFVVSHGAVPAMQYTISPGATQAGVMVQGLLYSYMEGVAPIIFDEQNFGQFNIRYKVKFNGQDSITTASLSYDALMVSAFAMSAIPSGEPITGANIAAQMSKLVDPDGTFVSFGENMFITTAVNALSVGGSVDLKGVSGELEFDLATGEPRTGLLGWQVIPLNNDVTKPALNPERIYVLNPEPAIDGMWAPLP